MSKTNKDDIMPSLMDKTIEVEILSPKISTNNFGVQIGEEIKKMLHSAVNSIEDTSREKLDRISTISIKTKYRFEVIPEDTEIAISLKN